MRKQISRQWLRAVWGLAGLALLAFTPAAGAQTSRAAGGGSGASGASGAGGLSGGSSSSGSSSSSGVSGGTGLSGSSTTLSGGTALQGGLGSASSSVSGSSASTTMPNTGGTIGQTGLMGNYYSNPYAMGLAYSGMTQSTFGQPLYNLQSLSGAGASTGTVGGLGTRSGSVTGAISGSTSRVGGGGASGGVGASGSRVGGGVGYGSSRSSMSSGQSTNTGPSAPLAQTYAISTAFDPPTPTLTSMRTDIQGVIDRSSRLPSRGNIQVLTDGSTLVLRGTVASEHERAVAELTARLTPGVLSLRNELQIRPRPGASASTR